MCLKDKKKKEEEKKDPTNDESPCGDFWGGGWRPGKCVGPALVP